LKFHMWLLFLNYGAIGEQSCNNADFACAINRNPIGDESCNADYACRTNADEIGMQSCNAEKDFMQTPSAIGNVACRSVTHECCKNDSDYPSTSTFVLSCK
jgi:hypothetical protein